MTTLQEKFGGEWDHFVDAVIFAYNVSVSEATGFSPFSLVYGRRPLLPDDIMYGVEAKMFKDEQDCNISCSQWMADAYRQVITNQAKMAETNRLRREDMAVHVTYSRGESVLYWQPSKPESNRPETDENLLALQTTPKKWSSAWTGPHEVVEQFNGNTYDIRSADTGEIIRANVNRLARFSPWSPGLPSTSPELDKPKKWHLGGTVKKDQLFIIPLPTADEPFAVGCLRGVSPTGTLHFTWLSNDRRSVRGTFRPGWRDTNGHVYYADTRDHSSHMPYTNDHSRTKATMKDVVVHGFSLTAGKKLPRPILRLMSTSGDVDWQLPS